MTGIINDFLIWRDTKWTYQQIHSQPEGWLGQMMILRGEAAAIENDLIEDARQGGNRPASASSDRFTKQKASNAEIEALRAIYPDCPDEMLRDLLEG